VDHFYNTLEMLVWRLLSLPLLVAIVGVSSQCSDVKLRKLQDKFNTCTRNFSEEHFAKGDGDTCGLIGNVVNTCGLMWIPCYATEEIAEMRDMHIRVLVKQYATSEDDLENCDVVKKYRQTTFTKDASEENNGINCNDEEMLMIQKKLQNCSHSVATTFYETINTIVDIRKELCQAIMSIDASCISHLHECFVARDLEQMRESHLDEMKSFLARISQDELSAGEDAFKSCYLAEDRAQLEEDHDDDKFSIVSVGANLIENGVATVTASPATEPELVENNTVVNHNVRISTEKVTIGGKETVSEVVSIPSSRSTTVKVPMTGSDKTIDNQQAETSAAAKNKTDPIKSKSGGNSLDLEELERLHLTGAGSKDKQISGMLLLLICFIMAVNSYQR